MQAKYNFALFTSNCTFIVLKRRSDPRICFRMNPTRKVRLRFVESVHQACLNFPNEVADHEQTLAADQFDDKRTEVKSIVEKANRNLRF